MELTLNGTVTEVKDNLTVTGLLEALDIEPGRVAVEINMSIIKKSEYDNHVLHNCDRVEVVNFVGGG